MKNIAEIIFDSSYLILIISMGGAMIIQSRNRKIVLLFGIMALVLGIGDSFHLIPRIYALSTDGLQNHKQLLSIGTFVASVSMTVFYVILFHIAKLRYSFQGKQLAFSIYSLAALRILLCLCPENGWLDENPSYAWEIYRNIPFLIIGILMIVLFSKEAKKSNDLEFRWMWLAITLSFAFYLPVVIWSRFWPQIGFLMIPKTLAYVWIVWMGYGLIKSEKVI